MLKTCPLAEKLAALRINAALCLAAFAGILLAGCSTTPRPLAMRQVSPWIFEGPKPKTDADFVTLRNRGIRTILSLQTLTAAVEPERRRAAANGMAFRNVPIFASPFPPQERHVREVLQILAEPSLRPIYFHCLLGRDRTEVMLALYRVYYENWTPEAAWKEMLHGGGFKSRWAMHGFETYFWRHSKKPAWVRSPMPEAKPNLSPTGPSSSQTGIAPARQSK